MKWSKILQFLIGSTLGVAVLVGGAVGAGYYLVKRLSTPPPRPTFANDRPSPAPKSAKSQAKGSGEKLEPGAYLAIVTYPDGLSVRDRPEADAGQVSSVDFQQEVVVLEETADRQWQHIRSQTSAIKGWVKGGNTEKVN